MQEKRHIKAIGIVFQNLELEVLVLKRHSQSLEAETWGLVGGNIDEGESSLEAAVRECKEEINVDIRQGNLKFFKSYSWDRENILIDFDVFQYEVSDNFEILLDENENTEFKWVKAEELYKSKDLMIGLYPILEDLYKL